MFYGKFVQNASNIAFSGALCAKNGQLYLLYSKSSKPNLSFEIHVTTIATGLLSFGLKNPWLFWAAEFLFENVKKKPGLMAIKSWRKNCQYCNLKHFESHLYTFGRGRVVLKLDFLKKCNVKSLFLQDKTILRKHFVSVVYTRHGGGLLIVYSMHTLFERKGVHAGYVLRFVFQIRLLHIHNIWRIIDL